MINELRLEPVRKRMQKVEGNITKAFTEQTSLTPAEIMEAYPFSLGFTVHTLSRTFHGMLTYSGRVKKNSINEETSSK
ncbi:hypothetical protein AAKU52_002598 [Pedobacter sp. CG_S7]|uniref:hypothetical protein n=1 Tax=Pedobacter sp. CG_S7 TaxID=3143930 RepID=UPI0033928B6D